MEPTVFRLSYLSQWKIQSDRRRGVSDLRRLLGHSSLYEHSLKYSATAERGFGRSRKDRTEDGREEGDTLPEELPKYQERQSQPARHRLVVVNATEIIDEENENTSEDSDDDSSVKDIETSREDEWDGSTYEENDQIDGEYARSEQNIQVDLENSTYKEEAVRPGQLKDLEHCMQLSSLLDDQTDLESQPSSCQSRISAEHWKGDGAIVPQYQSRDSNHSGGR